jgi:NTP pyrophosphatase (non-canonical NTP hydrolase)
MNQLQYLLVKLAEEASEVSQIALKTSQFGMDEVYPKQEQTNKERIHQELNDLLGIVQMLNDSFAFEFLPSESAINKKTQKVSHYLEYSKQLGMVQ